MCATAMVTMSYNIHVSHGNYVLQHSCKFCQPYNVDLYYREAAKECRRKKKEYVKCLENRVAVLENQNKALIEELKSLKELYCQKDGGVGML